jgi:hypothetical protein
MLYLLKPKDTLLARQQTDGPKQKKKARAGSGRMVLYGTYGET